MSRLYNIGNETVDLDTFVSVHHEATLFPSDAPVQFLSAVFRGMWFARVLLLSGQTVTIPIMRASYPDWRQGNTEQAEANVLVAKLIEAWGTKQESK